MLDLGFAAIAVLMVIALYIVIYMPYVARVDFDSRVYAPMLIPAATISGVLALLWWVRDAGSTLSRTRRQFGLLSSAGKGLTLQRW